MGAKVKKLKRDEKVTSNSVQLSELLGREFQIALATLMNSPDLPVKTSYALLCLTDIVAAHQKHFEDMRLRLLEKYGCKDAEGQLKLSENKAQYLLADKESFDKEYAELCSIIVELPKISLTSLEGAKLSPTMLSVLLKTVVTPQL